MIAELEERTTSATYELQPFLAARHDNEYAAQHKAEQLIRSVGQTVLSETVERPASSEAETLMDAVHQAWEGSAQARRQVEANVRTDIIERTIKAGHITSTKVDVDRDGRLFQHGQYVDDVQKNALKYASDHPIILGRTKAEIRNSARIEKFNGDGTFDDYAMVVVSMCDDSAPDEELDKLGFFTRTKSCSLQMTTTKEGEIVTESAFVAGVKAPGENRHDRKTAEKLAAKFKADYTGKTVTEIIDTPILIPKAMLPNGLIDLVKLYDEAAGNTFFGEDKPARDYYEFAEECKKREKEFEPLVQKIANELIADSDLLETPTDATERLHVLSQQTMLNRAVEDTQIDPMVFGSVSAKHIESARQQLEHGNLVQAMRSVDQAQRTATSSSCPAALRKKKNILDNELDSEEDDDWKKDAKNWKKGICRVEACPTRPGSTKVGPCDVCVGCQAKFDKGIDPTKLRVPLRRVR